MIRSKPHARSTGIVTKKQIIPKKIEFQLKPNPFQLKGYEFICWNTKPDGSGDSYDDEQARMLFENNANLYAQWKVIQYDITYDVNGHGKLPKGLPDTYTVEDEIELPILEETGYTFLGWRTNDGNTVSKIEKGSMGDREFTAFWEDDIVNLILHRNKDASDPTQEIYEYNRGLRDTIPYNAWLNDGHDFIGWSNENSEIEYIYHEGQKIILKDNMDLYAVWKSWVYQVVFLNKDGSKWASYKVNWGEITPKPIEPEWEGYRFDGWIEDVDNPIYDDMEFHPKFNRIVCHVTFYDDPICDSSSSSMLLMTPEDEINGYVSYGIKPYDEKYVYWGEDIIPPTEHPDSRRKYHYIPNGWDKSLVNIREENMIVTALYLKQPKVTFNAGQGSYPGTEQKKITVWVDPGTPLKEVPNFDIIPKWKGYDFLGWRNQDGVFVDEAFVVSRDCDLNAVYEKIPFTVNFYKNIEDTESDLIKSVKCKEGQKLGDVIEDLPYPGEEEYHTFICYTYDDGTKPSLNDEITKDVNIHARWKFYYLQECQKDGIWPVPPLEDTYQIKLQPGTYHGRYWAALWHTGPGGYVEFNAPLDKYVPQATVHLPYKWLSYGKIESGGGMHCEVIGLSTAYACTGIYSPLGCSGGECNGGSVTGGGFWGDLPDSSDNRIKRTKQGSGTRDGKCSLYNWKGHGAGEISTKELKYSKIELSCDLQGIIRKPKEDKEK